MLFRWLARKIQNAEQLKNPSVLKTVGIDENENDQIRFYLTSAVGGRILKVRRFDRKTHEDDVQTYVIPQGEDVGERVTKIINLELLK
jgi:hypothetical protein